MHCASCVYHTQQMSKICLWSNKLAARFDPFDAQILKGQPHRCALSELITGWYKTFPPDHFRVVVDHYRSNTTHMNVSRQLYARNMAHTWMKSCHTYERERSHISMSCASRVSHVAETKESADLRLQMSQGTHIWIPLQYEWPLAYEWPLEIFVDISWGKNPRLCLSSYATNNTNMNDPGHTYEQVIPLIQHKPRRTPRWDHTSVSHTAEIEESAAFVSLHQSRATHIWMTHVIRMNDSCHTYR